MMIELVSQDLPDFASDDLQARVDAAAALDPLGGRWPRRRHASTCSPAGLLTSTEDTMINRRIGLHVDNWDRLPRLPW
ncbi:hypothetical protein [Streptosporangium roseum]|uniref:hypothetical protein n=1 Tax=Streptosporangium roseum TaxID=2001 RepID=UPI0012DCE68F|nr:hypothetical protein [Streptosporangium roseum]